MYNAYNLKVKQENKMSDKMKNQKIPHCRDKSKIQSNTHRNKVKLDTQDTHLYMTTHFSGLVHENVSFMSQKSTS